MILIALVTISSILDKSINWFLWFLDLRDNPSPPKAGKSELIIDPKVPGMANACIPIKIKAINNNRYNTITNIAFVSNSLEIPK